MALMDFDTPLKPALFRLESTMNREILELVKTRSRREPILRFVWWPLHNVCDSLDDTLKSFLCG